MPQPKRGLGKGLGALIPSAPAVSEGVEEVELARIAPNPLQPRHAIQPETLQELADSIREHGVIQPLIVTRSANPVDDMPYTLIAGERRWQAARLAGLERAPVIIKEATPQQMLELALVENIQRADLNPLEEAVAYQQLADEFGLTQERIAERVGRSRVSITNTLRLLRLPERIKMALMQGEITEGHARTLLMLDDEEEQLLALRTVVKRQLSVRQTEELVRRLEAATGVGERTPSRSPESEALESQFRDALGTKVDLFRSRKGGRLVIHFYSEEDLQALFERIVGAE